MERTTKHFWPYAITMSLACMHSIALCQSSQVGVIGTPSDATAYAIPGLGFVNLNNGNLHFELSLRTVQDRNGKELTTSLMYDSNAFVQVEVRGPGAPPQYYPAVAACVGFCGVTPYVNQWQSGLRIVTTPTYGGGVTWTQQYIQSGTTCGGSGGNTYSNWQYVDGHGTVHPFPPSATTGDSTLLSCGYPAGFQGGATDGSGFWIAVSNQTSAVVYDVHGNIVTNTVKDTNGNIANGDQLGRTLGQLPGWTSTYKTIYVWTKLGIGTEIGYNVCGGAPCTTTGAIPETVLSTLKRPDGRSYAFQYDDAGPPQGTNGQYLSTQQGHYGTLTGVTLPTGGQIIITNEVLTYGSALNGVVVQSIQTPDGTWSFGYSSSPMTVTAPVDPHTGVGSQTTCACGSGGVPQTVSVYSGTVSGTPLLKVIKQYSSRGHPSSITTTLNGTTTRTVAYTYPDSCTPRISSKKEYDYSGSLIRETDVTFYTSSSDNTALCSYGSPTFSDTYLQNGHHIVDIPQQVTVYGSSGSAGSPVAQTKFTYDSTPLSTTSGSKGSSILGLTVNGNPIHDDANFGSSMTKRGNLTVISQMTTPGTFITTRTNYYNILGDLIQTVDGNGNSTNYDLTDQWHDASCISAPVFAFPTTITDAKGFVTQMTYNSCDGSVASVRDQNDINANPARAGTVYTYDGVQRSINLSYPDGGNVRTCYGDPTPPALCPSGSAVPEVITRTVTASPDPNIVSTQTLDGLGRTANATGANGAMVVTTYDTRGRVLSVTNPYFSTADPTYGVTTFYYDALDRPTSRLNADTVSTQTWSYLGNVTTFTDEAGHQWQRTSDGIGRLTKVLEPNGTTNTPTFETDYVFDPLGNLTCVEQHGGVSSTGCSAAQSNDASSSWRVRRFSYDGLSRLVSASNPESGAISYTYDAGNNVVTKTAPAVNVSSGTQTLGYCYDALNRITFKFYSGSFNCASPSGYAAAYTYDSSSIAGYANVVGRLTDEKAYLGSTLISERSPYQYDAVGRIKAEQQTPYKPSSGTFLFLYGYDAAGNLTCENNGFAALTSTNSCLSMTALASTIVVQNTYNPAGQLQYARTTLQPSSFSAAPPYLFQANSTSPHAYDAPGHLASAQLGLIAPNGTPAVQWTLLFDKRGRLVSNVAGTLYSLKPNGTTPQYDSVGNLTNYSDSVMGNWAFTYDTLNRLVGTSVSSGTFAGEYGCWTYDPWGNRSLEAFTQKTTTPCAPGAPVGSPYTVTTPTLKNQISTSVYDAAGDAVGDGRNNYAFDAAGRLCAKATGVAGGGTTYTEYLYDAEGRRVVKVPGTSRSCAAPVSTPSNLYLLGLGGEQVSELNGSASAQHSNLLLPGGLVASYDFVNGGLHMTFGDQVGTKRAQAVIKSNGTTVTATAELNFQSFPFGNNLTNAFAVTTVPVGSGGVDATEQHFTGKEHDSETGNDFFGSRYYASTTGRFLSPDPSQLYFADPANPQNLNLYSYGQNNPLRNVDPNGLRCVWDDGSFDAEDDSKTGKQGDCEDLGGRWETPGTYASGVDWASTNPDGTLTLHGAGADATVNVFGNPPGIPGAVDDFVTTTLTGKALQGLSNLATFLIFTPDNRDYGPQRIWLNTTYCGPGGSGPATGILNGGCAVHDKCFEDAGIDANGNTSGGPTWSLSQAAAAKQCNQALYNTARANPLLPGSKALQGWLTKGDKVIPFGYVLKPGTESKAW